MSTPLKAKVVAAALLLGVTTSACNKRQKNGAPKTPQTSTQMPGATNNTGGSLGIQNSTRAPSDVDTVYVAIGGWNSCVEDSRIPGKVSPYGMNMNKEFSKFIDHISQLRQGRSVHYVIACHTPNIAEIRSVFSSQPSVLKVGSHENFYAEVASFAKSLQAPIVLMGHSYGGDFVMRASLAIPRDQPISQLYTIDGISTIYCPAEIFVKQAASKIGQIFGSSQFDPSVGLGCTQAPRDFTEAQRQDIRSRVAWWQNYYQSDLFSVLKSSSIGEACNQRVSHKTLKGLVNGHIAMGMYDSLWNDITQRVSNPVPGTCVENDI